MGNMGLHLQCEGSHEFYIKLLPVGFHIQFWLLFFYYNIYFFFFNATLQ